MKLNEKLYACIQKYNIKDNDFFFNVNGNYYSNEIKKLRENGIFQNKFYVGYLIESEAIIDADMIICKCISINVKDNEDFYYLSEYENEQEHD